MKTDAVAVCSSNLEETLKFYSILGFKFEKIESNAKHIEAKREDGARLMIDSMDMIEGILGVTPQPSNHSSFALEYENPKEIDEIYTQLIKLKYQVVKEPWDAFWGQRYCIVLDPDGYMIDLFCNL